MHELPRQKSCKLYREIFLFYYFFLLQIPEVKVLNVDVLVRLGFPLAPKQETLLGGQL